MKSFIINTNLRIGERLIKCALCNMFCLLMKCEMYAQFPYSIPLKLSLLITVIMQFSFHGNFHQNIVDIWRHCKFQPNNRVLYMLDYIKWSIIWILVWIWFHIKNHFAVDKLQNLVSNSHSIYDSWMDDGMG